jgi:hypothetical protein
MSAAGQYHRMRCSGPLDRRTWLKVGGLSLGALAAGLEPNLAHLLAAEQAATSSGSQPDRDFSVILFWANGGPSHIDLFDLKPEAPAEYREEEKGTGPNAMKLVRNCRSFWGLPMLARGMLSVLARVVGSRKRAGPPVRM